MLETIGLLRTKEEGALRKRSHFIAVNMAVNAIVTPVMCLATFGTAWGLGQTLTVTSVFYVIALLTLPRLWMAIFFLRSVESLTEAGVSLRRLAEFLGLPEAPPPLRLRTGEELAALDADSDNNKNNNKNNNNNDDDDNDSNNNNNDNDNDNDNDNNNNNRQQTTINKQTTILHKQQETRHKKQQTRKRFLFPCDLGDPISCIHLS